MRTWFGFPWLCEQVAGTFIDIKETKATRLDTKKNEGLQLFDSIVQTLVLGNQLINPLSRDADNQGIGDRTPITWVPERKKGVGKFGHEIFHLGGFIGIIPIEGFTLGNTAGMITGGRAVAVSIRAGKGLCSV